MLIDEYLKLWLEIGLPLSVLSKIEEDLSPLKENYDTFKSMFLQDLIFNFRSACKKENVQELVSYQKIFQCILSNSTRLSTIALAEEGTIASCLRERLREGLPNLMMQFNSANINASCA